MSGQVFIGETHEIRYPFSRGTHVDWDENGAHDVPSWRPGCDRDQDDAGHVAYACEGHGFMILQVIARFKPGKYPERVFYVRRWRDPEGREFGKGTLRMTTTGNFRKMLHGYRHSYYDAEADAEVPPNHNSIHRAINALAKD